jgi:hypothetical protein
MDHRVEPGGDEFCEALLLSKNSDAKNRAAGTNFLSSPATRGGIRWPIANRARVVRSAAIRYILRDMTQRSTAASIQAKSARREDKGHERSGT